MASANTSKVISALAARSRLGRMLDEVAEHRRSYVIEKRGSPKAILLGIKDYIRLASPEPEILKVIGEASTRRGASKITSRQIDRIIEQTRAEQARVKQTRAARKHAAS